MPGKGRPFQKGHAKFPGSGMLKGQKTRRTLARERALMDFEDRFYADLPDMGSAQVAHAKGVRYMVLRMPDGSYTRATNEKQVNAALAAGATMFDLFTAAPNTQAFMALWDRVVGKPAETTRMEGPDGGPLEIVVKKPW